MINISICVGSSCHLKGSYEIIETLQRLIVVHQLEDSVDLMGSFCLGRCAHGVALQINGEDYSVLPENVEDFFQQVVLKAL